MNRQLTMVICRQLLLIWGKCKIYSNKVVKHLTHLTQHVPRNQTNISLCYLLGSYKRKYFGTTLQHTYMINLRVYCFTYWLIWLGTGGLGAYIKRNILTEVDHIGHKFTKYCCLKLAGSIMKYWLYFVARVGWSELDVSSDHFIRVNTGKTQSIYVSRRDPYLYSIYTIRLTLWGWGSDLL